MLDLNFWDACNNNSHTSCFQVTSRYFYVHHLNGNVNPLNQYCELGPYAGDFFLQLDVCVVFARRESDGAGLVLSVSLALCCTSRLTF